MEHYIVARNADSLFPYQGWPTIARDGNGVLYAAVSGHRLGHVCPFGKNYLYISKDEGKSWGMPVVIEEDKERGYCYPAVFFTKDNSMLCGYCRGGKDDPNCLARLGIMKIGLDEME